jgi:TolB protein
MDAAGGEARNLTNHPANDFGPSWSPDGAEIAFTTNRDCDDEIYVMNADGSAPRNLSNTPGPDRAPVWSPDGSRILFAVTIDDNIELFVMDRDGGNRTRLTDDPAWDWTAAWSPDGERIAFSSNRDGTYQLYVMDADGGDPVALTSGGTDKNFPSWSSDGDRLAYVTRDGIIRILTADGQRDEQLPTGELRAFDVAWSPVEDRLAFTTEDDGNREIYAINLDGTELVNLTNHPASDSYPVWSPDGAQISFASNRSSPATADDASPVAGGPAPAAVDGLPSCLSRLERTETTWTLRGDCRTDSTITLQDGRTLDGNGHTIWVVEPEAGVFTGNVIERVGGTASVMDLTISGAALTAPCGEDQWLAGIRFDGVEGTISNVTIDQFTRGEESYCGTGILVQGAAGVSETDRATTTVEDNTISGVGFVGIFARDRVEATIMGNTVTDVGHRGIAILGPVATGTVRDNTVERVGNVGIAAEGSAAVVIAGNSVIDASAAGIVAQSGATEARIERNQVRGGQYGIFFDQARTTGTATGNEVSGTTDHAIAAFGAQAMVTDNDLTSVAGAGVAGLAGAEVTASDNRINQAGNGLIAVGAGSRGVFERNEVRDITGTGMVALDGAHVTANDNTVTISDLGIGVDGVGSTALISDNVVTDTARSGIGIVGGAEATITTNTIQDVGGNGIAITGAGTETNVKDNRVARASGAGILVLDAAHAHVTGNVVTEPGPMGPASENRAGVAFRAQTTGSIVGNTIDGYVASPGSGCDVSIAADAGQVDMGDNLTAGTQDEVKLCDARSDDGVSATPA